MTEQDFRDGFNSSQDETWLAVYADWLEENGRPDEARHVRKAKAGGGSGGGGGGSGGSGDGGDGGGGGDDGDGGGGSGGGGGGGDGGGGGGDGGGDGGGGGGGGGSGGGIIQGELRMFSVGERLLVIVRSGYNPAAYVGTVTKVFNGGLGVVLDGVMCNWCPGGDWQGLARGDKALRAKGGAQYRAHGGAVRLPEIARAHDWVGDLPEWK